MSRQTVSRPSTIIPPPKTQSGRDRTWERRHPTASYRLPTALRERIAAIANERGLITAEIARALLEHGLAAYDAGDLQLTPHIRGKLTLFPEDD